MVASSRVAVPQSPAAGACRAEGACRSPWAAACQVAADPTAASVAARALALLQKSSHALMLMYEPAAYKTS